MGWFAQILSPEFHATSAMKQKRGLEIAERPLFQSFWSRIPRASPLWFSSLTLPSQEFLLHTKYKYHLEDSRGLSERQFRSSDTHRQLSFWFCSLSSETILTVFHHLPFWLHAPTCFLHSVWMCDDSCNFPRCGRCRQAGGPPLFFSHETLSFLILHRPVFLANEAILGRYQLSKAPSLIFALEVGGTWFLFYAQRLPMSWRKAVGGKNGTPKFRMELIWTFQNGPRLRATSATSQGPWPRNGEGPSFSHPKVLPRVLG